MQIIAALVMAGIAFLCFGVYLLVDSIITKHRLKINQEAWDKYSKNMNREEKLDKYVPWCEEQRIKNKWNFYYLPRIYD